MFSHQFSCDNERGGCLNLEWERLQLREAWFSRQLGSRQQSVIARAAAMAAKDNKAADGRTEARRLFLAISNPQCQWLRHRPKSVGTGRLWVKFWVLEMKFWEEISALCDDQRQYGWGSEDKKLPKFG